jgi:hypothetical protein
MNLLLRVLLAGALVLSAGAVRAEPASPSDPDELPPIRVRAPVRGRAHEGFFAQLSPVGLAYFETRGQSRGEAAKLSGVGNAFSVAVGANVVENLVLAAELWFNGAARPNGEFGARSKTLTDEVTALAAIGPRLTYYLMPVNAFVSVTPSIGTLLLVDDRKDSQRFARGGFALRVAAGKEWWIAPRFALGFNVHYGEARNVDREGTNPTWTSRAFGVGFTVTRD